MSFCLYFVFILTKPWKQDSELLQKISKIEGKYFFSLLHEFQAYPKVFLRSVSLTPALECCSFSGFLVDGKLWLIFGVIYLFFSSWINIRKYLLICVHIGMRSSELLSCALFFVGFILKLSLNRLGFKDASCWKVEIECDRNIAVWELQFCDLYWDIKFSKVSDLQPKCSSVP